MSAKVSVFPATCKRLASYTKKRHDSGLFSILIYNFCPYWLCLFSSFIFHHFDLTF